MKRNNIKPDTLLTRPLTKKQQAHFNYLLPVVVTTLIYVIHFASDFCLAIQHYRDKNFGVASWTFFWIYCPVIGSFLVTVLNVWSWPEGLQCSWTNVKWIAVKGLEHLLVPVWAMYRFAEQLFWSIEAVRCRDENTVDELLLQTERNSIFELYHFLQAYMQATPQILFQLNQIFQQPANFKKVTVDMQVFCIIMSLIKMSMTTMSYQRFKSQKLAGRQYPWLKSNLQAPTIATSFAPPLKSPTAPVAPETDPENSEPEADRDAITDDRRDSTTSSELNAIRVERRGSGLSVTSSQFNDAERGKDEPDFLIPLRFQINRGLVGDDAAGKLVAFCWWFCFILARLLALSTFGYLYPKEMLWICSSHYVITLAFLLYDVHISEMSYYRAPFLLFTAYIYMFCLIEFKVKFKKVRFIYNGYFTLVYLENFIITCVWYFGNDFDTDWWYKYIFYLLIGTSLISLLSMLFYIFILKPKKVTVSKTPRNTKIL